MFITSILFIIIPIQLILLGIIISLCVKIFRNKINVDDFSKFISSPGRATYDKTGVIKKIVKVVESNEAKGKTLNYDDISDLIYNELTKNDSIIRAFINNEVILGLAGTFFGLILALSNISPVSISQSLSAGDFINALIEQMEPFLKGLSTAFGASFAGVVCMLIGNLIYSIAVKTREKNINELLYVISSELLPSLASVKPEEKIYQSVDHFSEKVEELTEKIRESLFDFNSRFEVLIKKTTDSFNTTLDKILDENKVALNTQVSSLQSSANDLIEIKNNILTTVSSVAKSSEKQFEEISNLHKRIETHNKQFVDDLRIYMDSQSKLIGMFGNVEIKQSELVTQYSEHFVKLQRLGEQAESNLINTSDSLTKMLEKVNIQIHEHFNNISAEYDKRLLEAVSIFNNKSSEVFDKFNNNSTRLDELINRTGQNAKTLETILYSSLHEIEVGLKTNLNELSQNFKENLFQLDLFNKQFPEFLTGMETNSSQIKATINGFDSIVERFEKNVHNNVTQYFVAIDKSAKNLETYFNSIETEFNTITRSHQVTGDFVKLMENAVDKAADQIKQFSEAKEEVRRVFDEFSYKFLEKQQELFTKITEQEDIPINVFVTGDGAKFLKNIGKAFSLSGDKRKSSSEKEIKPLTPSQGYRIKECGIKGEEEVEKPEELSVVKQKPISQIRNRFTKFLFNLFGLDKDTILQQGTSSRENQDEIIRDEIKENEKSKKDRLEPPIQ